MNIISWLVPPVVGALIGYVTNLVAIRMLFRPLNEVKIFGIRLPFTPGIFPKERHKLADSIGRMVEQELLTPGVLRERLGRTEVREKIKTALGTYIDSTLDKPLSFYLEEKQGEFPLSDILKDFVNSEVFDSFLEEIIRNWARRKFFPKKDAASQNTDGSLRTEGSLGSWIKNQVKNFGEVLIPRARDIIKDDLVRGMKDNSRGNDYRQALEKITKIYPGITLREFIALGKTEKQKVDSFLTQKVSEIMNENIENALSSINVRVMVSDRINSLDMIKVEKIILDVMAGQLKWVNFFGGFLGALIGFAQVILSLFMR